jgi:hemerythrin-like domain-containing protein
MPCPAYRGRVPVGEGVGGHRSSGSAGRARALGAELRRLHDRIREVLDDARDGIDPGAGGASVVGDLADDLVLRCHAVCTTLGAHHRDEDTALFPWLRREHPGLGDVVDRLEQDHAMIGSLLAGLEGAVRSGASGRVVLGHLEGVDAIMESHFRYEERELVPLLDAIVGDGPPLPDRFWAAG